MILIWYRYIDYSFRCKYYKHYANCKYYLGYKDSYGYEVVQILYLSDDKIYNCLNFNHYYYLKNNLLNKEHKSLKSCINMFLDKIRTKK